MAIRKSQERPSQKDYYNFLLKLAYKDTSVLGCIKSSYLDFCRTLRLDLPIDVKKEQMQKIKSEAFQFMKERFECLIKKSFKDQRDFDDWHRSICEDLIEIFPEHKFHYGQAQKWVNMTFKNIYVCGKERISGYDTFYKLCHAPIDNIILEQLEKEGIDKPNGAWSRWDYLTYIGYQNKIRDVTDSPLYKEFQMWLVA